MEITKDIRYVGVNDHQVDLFEGQYVVPLGMAYNSYVILDERVAVMDTVDQHFADEWLENLHSVLNGRKPDLLIVQHMEPDHSANIKRFCEVYPDTVLVGNELTFGMMDQFFPEGIKATRLTVRNGEKISLGRHELTFVFAPMVHWPEVMVTYDSTDKVLFSADGFGKFGANDVEDPEGWACEARRYYFGIVGKYGMQTQDLLKAAAGLDIQIICPLHGPVLKEDLGYYLNLYDKWSSYVPEEEGILIAYTSVYGPTKEAVLKLAELLRARACPKVSVMDLARDDMPETVEDAFRYSKIVLATTTYNGEIFPFMREFIHHLTERNYQNRTVAFIENGTWSPQAAKVMREMFGENPKLDFAKTTVTIRSALNAQSEAALVKLADELCREYVAQSSELANKNDKTAMFKIGYGLYVITSNDGTRDNGFICNTVVQVANDPQLIAVCINKANYSHDTIKETGIMNINFLDVTTPFKVFQHFGFQSGRNVNKFENCERELRTDNGLLFLPKYINGVMSLQVESYTDLGSHGMFLCKVTEMRVMSDKESITYSYYQSNVKPKPQPTKKKGFVCKVYGYIYEGEELPADFICPLCKHGAEDFEPLG